jgi:hypothetical protein
MVLSTPFGSTKAVFNDLGPVSLHYEASQHLTRMSGSVRRSTVSFNVWDETGFNK